MTDRFGFIKVEGWFIGVKGFLSVRVYSKDSLVLVRRLKKSSKNNLKNMKPFSVIVCFAF